jgi:integrase
VKPPTVTRKDWTLLTRADFSRLLHEIPEPYKPLVTVAAYSGLRWSELVALTRADYNPLRKTLHVTKAVDAKGRTTPTKNNQNRTVHLPTAALTALNQQTQALAPTALIFTAPRGGRLTASNFARTWAPARERAGLTCRFHDLRHSCASWLLEAGATLAEVRDHLGHSSVTVTELYLHTDQESLSATVERAFG